MHFVGQPTECHICRKVAMTSTEKCKLCCDGFEHEFCAECSKDYREMRRHIGTQEGKLAFGRLRDRSAAAFEAAKAALKGGAA